MFFFDFANFLKVQSVGLRGDEGTHIVLPFRPELAGNEDGSFTLFHTFFLWQKLMLPVYFNWRATNKYNVKQHVKDKFVM